jgi:hypothetical protein
MVREKRGYVRGSREASPSFLSIDTIENRSIDLSDPPPHLHNTIVTFPFFSLSLKHNANQTILELGQPYDSHDSLL